ncbi:Fc receptor-like protein 4 isoform X2 [Xenopus laevis]|uniref:Fc receptor-like protein 4 isoform X2 n=1 Tax=Xenopus laevis TaxID=8355 RepID=A0A8J1LKK0_XENLA|nr:Fc receptor-like protein 4 isoform X2 [Xenopus laevis]
MSISLSVILLSLLMGKIGAAARPVISFSPNWTPILTGDSVTLTCNGAPPAQGNEKYSWDRDNNPIPGEEQQNYTIQRAQREHSGRYQCQTSERSAAINLTVSDDKVVLQAPPGVHEGEELILRCYTRPEYKATNTVFYKNNSTIQSRGSDYLVLGRAQTHMSGSYRCTTEIYDKYVGYAVNYTSADEHLSVTELFSPPQIKVTPDPVTEGDHMTITCDTNPRNTTELQFAFYINKTQVQGFDSSSYYTVSLAQMNNAGKYNCVVQTASGSVNKNSSETHIHIQELFSPPQIKVTPDQVTEGDHMTITCDTNPRNTTELQFAFYINGTVVQEFSSSHEYRVPSAAPKDSGKYTCEVQTTTGSVRKRSSELNISNINKSGNNNLDNTTLMLIIVVTVALTVLISLLIIALLILKSKKKQHGRQSSRRKTLSGPGETNLDEDVCYMSINFNRQPKAHSTSQNNDDGDNVIYAAVKGSDRRNTQAAYKQVQRENSVVYAALKTPGGNKNNQELRTIPQDENCVYASVKKR